METPTKTPSNTILTRGYAFSEKPDSPEKGVSSAIQLSRGYATNPMGSNTPGYKNPDISKNLFGSDNQSAGKKRRKSKKGGKWSRKYKRSINCRRPKGFSQRQHCKYGRRSRRR